MLWQFVYLWGVDDQPALGARLNILAAQRLPQTNFDLNSTSCVFTAVHHLPEQKKKKNEDQQLLLFIISLALWPIFWVN